MIRLAKHGNKTIRAKKEMTSAPRINDEGSDTKKDGLHNSSSSLFSNSKESENVLILQGGGSLGAFGCGVFKALAEKNVKIDIVAGTSIGGVNAAIIAGSRNEGRPEQLLEEFWLELTDSFVDLENTPVRSLSPQLEQMISNYYSYYTSSLGEKKNESLRKMKEYRDKSIMSFLSSAIFGNSKMFKPRWALEYS